MFNPKNKKNEIAGKEAHTNPTFETAVARKKARMGRIKRWLNNPDKVKRHPEKAAYLEKAMRRLELEIQLREGDT